MDIITKDHELFKRLVPAICEIYGSNLVSIVLYGSVARNEATKDSDIDIAIFVKADDLHMHDKMHEVLAGLDLEYDQLIVPSMIDVKTFNKWKKVSPYYINIEREGIVLWKAA